MHIGNYINNCLRPILVGHTRNEQVLGWEAHLRETVYTRYTRRGSALAGRLAYLLLFPAVPAISLLALLSYLDSIELRPPIGGGASRPWAPSAADS